MRRLLALVPASAVLMLPAVAGAAWSASAQGPAQIGATTMTNASNFTASCTTTSKTSTVTLAWTHSPDPFVDGYEIVRTGSGGGTNATFRVGRTTAGMTDSPKTGNGISYTYTIRAGSQTIAWTTAPATAKGRPTYSSNACVTN